MNGWLWGEGARERGTDWEEREGWGEGVQWNVVIQDKLRIMELHNHENYDAAFDK